MKLISRVEKKSTIGTRATLFPSWEQIVYHLLPSSCVIFLSRFFFPSSSRHPTFSSFPLWYFLLLLTKTMMMMPKTYPNASVFLLNFDPLLFSFISFCVSSTFYFPMTITFLPIWRPLSLPFRPRAGINILSNNLSSWLSIWATQHNLTHLSLSVFPSDQWFSRILTAFPFFLIIIVSRLFHSFPSFLSASLYWFASEKSCEKQASKSHRKGTTRQKD